MKIVIQDLNENDFLKIKALFSDEYKIVNACDKALFCQGCFGCWFRNPGCCRYKDTLKDIGSQLSSAEQIIIISRNCYGGYSPEVKRIVDRSLSQNLPWFVYRSHRIHHPCRTKNISSLRVFFYGDISAREKTISEELIHANCINRGIEDYKITFVSSPDKINGAEL